VERLTKETAELALIKAINAASLLFGAQLASVVRLTFRTTLLATTVLARRKAAFFKRALRCVTALSL
jgi:hypothetical protein